MLATLFCFSKCTDFNLKYHYSIRKCRMDITWYLTQWPPQAGEMAVILKYELKLIMQNDNNDIMLCTEK